MTITEQLRAPDLGQLIELYEFDQTPIDSGLPIIYLTPSTSGAAGGVVRNSISYFGVPIEGSGFERGGDGAFPQPTVRFANISPLLDPWISGAQDMVGAVVTRTIVLGAWLDGAADADATAFLTRDQYEIDQKVKQNSQLIEFKLRNVLDRADMKLPRRQALASCQLRYRVWDSAAAAYDYSKATCPYDETAAAKRYTIFNTANTDPEKDECSKTITGCKLRFSSAASLPMTGFPGIGK